MNTDKMTDTLTLANELAALTQLFESKLDEVVTPNAIVSGQDSNMLAYNCALISRLSEGLKVKIDGCVSDANGTGAPVRQN